MIRSHSIIFYISRFHWPISNIIVTILHELLATFCFLYRYLCIFAKMRIHLRIISLLLMFTIMLSTGGVVISKHICDGEVKDIGINQDAKGCDHSMQKQAIQCPVHENMVIYTDQDSKGCCEDTADYLNDHDPKIDVINELNPKFQVFLLYTVQFITVDTYSNSFSLDNYYSEFIKPPLLNQEIPILTQQFLL